MNQKGWMDKGAEFVTATLLAKELSYGERSRGSAEQTLREATMIAIEDEGGTECERTDWAAALRFI